MATPYEETKELETNEEEEEVFASHYDSENGEDRIFDETVGALEELLMDEEFSSAQQAFFRDNCETFEDQEENKLIYTQIFQKYVDMMETTLDRWLSSRVDNFSMQAFLALLEARGSEAVVADVWEILENMGDFNAFKKNMLEHKHLVQMEKKLTARASKSVAQSQTQSQPSSSSSSSSSSQLGAEEFADLQVTNTSRAKRSS